MTGRTVFLRLIALVLPLGLTACGGKAPGGKAAGSAGLAASGKATEIGMELRRGRDPQELVRIGTREVVIGPAGGPLQWKFFAEPRRSDDAWYFLSVYSSFQRKSPAGDLVFRGRGKVKPGPAEQRMIFDWVRQVAAEAAGGRSGSAYGLAIAWHQGGSSGICEDLSFYLTGEAVATGCGWDREMRGRIDPAQLDRVHGWFDRLQPFQAGGEQGEDALRPGSLETRLIFAGRGARRATVAEQGEIQAFASGLFSELAARRRGGAPAPAPPRAGAPEATPAPLAQRLLLPAKIAVQPEDEVVLELPDKAPPVPKPPPGPELR